MSGYGPRQPSLLPRRWPRRLALAAACLLVVAGLAVASVPWALSTRAGRNWLVSQARMALAPGGLEFESIAFSWFGPTRITGLVMIDPQGDRVAVARTAVWDRTFRQILFDRPNFGTLTAQDVRLDVERDVQGKIDLYETLRPVLKGDPRLALTIRVKDGQLRFRAPELTTPVEVDGASLTLAFQPEPKPLSFQLDLDPPALAGSERLSLRGSFDNWASKRGEPADFDVALDGETWPWTLAVGGLKGSGRLDGRVEVKRARGHFWTSGAGSVEDLILSGERLQGDTLRAKGLRADWQVAEAEEGWVVDRLELEAPFARLQGSGTLGLTANPTLSDLGASRGKLEGRVDLVELTRQLPRAFRLKPGTVLEGGAAEFRVVAGSADRRTTLDATANLSDLRGRQGDRRLVLKDPATLTARLVRPEGQAVRLDTFTAAIPHLKLTARSEGTDTTKLAGEFDLNGLERQLREVVDLGPVSLAGRGDMTGTYQSGPSTYKVDLNSRINALRVEGIGPVNVDREAAEVVLELNGPVGEAGIPSGWGSVRSSVRSGDLTADLEAAAGAARVKVGLTAPVSIGEGGSLARASVDAGWTEETVTFERLDAGLSPRKAGRAKPIRLAATGRYDRRLGRLAIDPLPGSEGLTISPEGVRVEGLASLEAVKADVGLQGELAALAGWLPETGNVLRGAWKAKATVRTGAEGLQLAAGLEVPESVVRPIESEGPTTPSLSLSFQGTAPHKVDRVEVSELAFKSRYATLELKGKLEEPRGRRHLDLTGLLTPNWETLNRLIVENVEPRATVRGKARTVSLRADLNDAWRDSIEGDVGLNLESADIYGMRMGPTALVMRVKGGKPSIDPFDVTVNEGRLHAAPHLLLEGEPGPRIHLGSDSYLADAVINEEVSHRVLSFVAPVMDDATRVRGRVSAHLKNAVFPLRKGSEAVQVEGDVVFQDVEFLPGPMLDPMLGMIGQSDRALVRLNKPVSLRIADRRVYQEGLLIPVGNLTEVGLDGWVDFDKKMNLMASFALPRPTLGDRPIFGGLTEGVKFNVPIRGTLDKPEVDTAGFQGGMKEFGKTLLDRTVGSGVSDLLDLFNRPRDPNAPPPPPRLTPRERRELRQERREERRQNRDPRD